MSGWLAGLARNDTTISQVSTAVMRVATPSVNSASTASEPHQNSSNRPGDVPKTYSSDQPRGGRRFSGIREASL